VERFGWCQADGLKFVRVLVAVVELDVGGRWFVERVELPFCSGRGKKLQEPRAVQFWSRTSCSFTIRLRLLSAPPLWRGTSRSNLHTMSTPLSNPGSNPPPPSPVFHWFRSDLRLHDNPALQAAAAHAAKTNRPLVPCYIFDPRTHGAKNPQGDLKTDMFRTK
jgi:hypothetical protein